MKIKFNLIRLLIGLFLIGILLAGFMKNEPKSIYQEIDEAVEKPIILKRRYFNEPL